MGSGCTWLAIWILAGEGIGLESVRPTWEGSALRIRILSSPSTTSSSDIPDEAIRSINVFRWTRSMTALADYVTDILAISETDCNPVLGFCLWSSRPLDKQPGRPEEIPVTILKLPTHVSHPQSPRLGHLRAALGIVVAQLF